MNTFLVPHRRLRSAWLLASLVLSSFLLSPSSFSQGTPSAQLIPFQGRLTNQAGVAYDNGQYTITLNLYSLAIGGSTVWTERHEKVSIIGGMLNLFFGSINSIAAVDFSTTKYLGITVDADNNPATADPEMVPRTMIVAAFSAKQSERTRTMDVLDGNGLPVSGQSFGWASVFSNGNPQTGTISGAKLTDSSVTVQKVETSLATAFVPRGAVLPYAASAAPSGWALCDGSSQLRTDPVYVSLYAVIGTTYGAVDGTHFNLPDLRGRVPAGLDTLVGGSNANRLTSSGSSINGTIIGAVGGAQAVTLTNLQSGVPAHSHGINDPGHFHSTNTHTAGGPGSNWTASSNVLAQNTSIYRAGPAENSIPGSTPLKVTGIVGTNNNSPQDAVSAHSVTQPTIVLNYIIKL